MDNTIIRDLFAKDINRSINGVSRSRIQKMGPSARSLTSTW